MFLVVSARKIAIYHPTSISNHDINPILRRKLRSGLEQPNLILPGYHFTVLKMDTASTD